VPLDRFVNIRLTERNVILLTAMCLEITGRDSISLSYYLGHCLVNTGVVSKVDLLSVTVQLNYALVFAQVVQESVTELGQSDE
jgi:hypothetical protein